MSASDRISTPLRIIAWIYLILGLVGLAAGIALCIGLALEPDPRAAEALVWIGFIFAIVATGYLVPAVIGGLGLLRGKAWARVPVAIVSVLLLFAFPIGTLLGGYGLWAIVSAYKQEEAPRTVTHSAAPLLRAGSDPVVGLLVAMAGVAAGFVVMLWAGFTLHHDAMPLVIEQYHLPAIGVFAAAIAYGLYRLMQGPRRGVVRPDPRYAGLRGHSDWEEEQRLRLIEMRNDPILSAYAGRIERGESWSDAQIAYDLEPDGTATCAHLAPVERAMRRAGIAVKLQLRNIVNAPCVIDESALRARFAIDPPAWYGIPPDHGRSYEDPPVAAFKCAEHGALIYVVESSQAPPGSPVFPV